MADKNQEKAKRLQRRKYSTRKGLFGSAERPRLSVFRSSKHIYAQLIDDYAGKTLASVGTLSEGVIPAEAKTGANIKAAVAVGKAIAEKAKSIGITKVAFDRSGRRYHGRIKALADAARKGGLQF